MKNKLSVTCFLLLITVLGYSSLYAQDDRLPEMELNREIRPDVNTEILTEGESKIIKPFITSRDSVQTKSIQKKPDNKSKSDDNKSVLSFNFLYYLIERYKLSDIVD